VVAVVSESPHAQAAGPSGTSVAAAALAAVVPAWLEAGRGAEQLLEAVVQRLPGVPPAHRLGMLASVLAAMPQARLVRALFLYASPFDRAGWLLQREAGLHHLSLSAFVFSVVQRVLHKHADLVDQVAACTIRSGSRLVAVRSCDDTKQMTSLSRAGVMLGHVVS
jgi:hypothetical protein